MLFGVGAGRIVIGRIMPSSLVSVGAKVKRMRRRWEMLINGEL